MAMTYGMALMRKHKREDLEDIHEAARKQQKRARKKGKQFAKYSKKVAQKVRNA